MEGKKDNNLYFKNGKPRKHPKKVKPEPEPEPEPVSVVKEDTITSMNIKPNESTCELYNADCLEKMKDLPDKSVDLIFCDLPYGQTSCKWDCKIDLEEFWKQVMRIKKLNTPIFFTTTTKFGVELIQSAPKRCHFRYDIVWCKSAPAGFLSAKKMPLRKHEMIYVFYEKLPFYDLSSHKHKFIEEPEPEPKKYVPPQARQSSKHMYDKGTYKTEDNSDNLYRKNGRKANESAYEPPLPTSVVKQEPKHKWVKGTTDIYGGAPTEDSKECGGHQQRYEPPLPNSMLEIKSTRGKHSTEKPVALMEWILKYYSKEGDVVLDPTCGSGSTGVACKNMNRKFIGIEMDEDIFNTARDRLN